MVPIEWSDPTRKKKKRANAWSMGKYKDTNQILHLLDGFGYDILYRYLVSATSFKPDKLTENRISKRLSSQFHLIDNLLTTEKMAKFTSDKVTGR